MINLLSAIQRLVDKISCAFSFLASLSLRIYLAPIFIIAGMNKLSHIENVAMWFGSIGIPAPELMAWMAGLTEFVGGIALLIGLGVRYAVIPLMFTMVVAATTAHWEKGWHVLPETELTMPWEWRTDLIEDGNLRKERAKEILKQHGNYSWLTQAGSFTVLKNGIEWAATYFLMLFSLFVLGAGRYLSLDYWIRRSLMPPSSKHE